MSRRASWQLLMFLGVVLLGAACTTSSQSPTSTPVTSTVTSTAIVSDTSSPQNDDSGRPIELVVWSEYFTQATMSTDPEGAGQYGIYLEEQFEKQHPNVDVRIEFHGWDETLRQNLQNALLAGTAPDVVVGENYFKQFAESGQLVPLDDHIADIKGNLIPGTYRAATYDGHIYGLSAFTGVFGFERNCDVVESAGLDCDTPPETWDELVSQSRMITEKGDGEYYGYTLQGPAGFTVGSVFRIAVLMAQSDATLCKEDCTYPYFNDPNALPVLELVRELNRYTPPGLAFEPHEGTVYEQLHHGLTAYQIAGSWHPKWAKENGCETCRYSPVPIPDGGHQASMIVGNVIYAVPAQSDHRDMGVAWVKFMTRDDVQALVYPTLGRLPSTRSALQDLRTEVDPATQTFIDQLLYTDDLGILPQWRENPEELWRIYNDMLIEVFTTERPIDELMDEAQAAAEEVMQQ